MAMIRASLRIALLVGVTALAGCHEVSTRHLDPIPPRTLSLMASRNMTPADPILIRAYKKEAEMEVWKRGANGRYTLLKTFPVCRWSGQLGPKVREGDRQTVEGFYTITPGQMNPNSSYYLSFDTGFPNAYDRANGRTGSYLMVHGTCSSMGCFAMTDETISELYALAREAFAGGQRAFQFQAYPFRMTAQNLATFRNDPNMPFWRNLKEGADYFEVTGQEPQVGVCGTRYAFGGPEVADNPCAPASDPAVAAKQSSDDRRIAELAAGGVAPKRLVYKDGGQNPVFRSEAAGAEDGSQPYSVKDYARRDLGTVSRPDALVSAPQEIAAPNPVAGMALAPARESQTGSIAPRR